MCRQVTGRRSAPVRREFKVIETVELQDWLLSVGAEKLQSAR